MAIYQKEWISKDEKIQETLGGLFNKDDVL